MPAVAAAPRPVVVSTNVDESPDKPAFIPKAFEAREQISQLFHADARRGRRQECRIHLRTTARLPDRGRALADSRHRCTRFFHGICRQVRQRGGDGTFNHYPFELVPQVWLLTKRAQSRIFQQMTVPDILKKVLERAGRCRRSSSPASSRGTTASSTARPTSTSPAGSWKKKASTTSSSTPPTAHQMVVANTPQSHRGRAVDQKITLRGSSRPATGRGRDLRVREGAGGRLRQGHPLGPLLRAAAQAPRGGQARSSDAWPSGR